MIIKKFPALKNSFFLTFFTGIFLSLLLLLLSFVLPSTFIVEDSQKSLKSLKKQAEAVKQEFHKLLQYTEEKKKALFKVPFPNQPKEIFQAIKQLNLDREKEGIGYYNRDGHLAIWLGKIIDLNAVLSEEDKQFFYSQKESSQILPYKASVYLLSFKKIRQNEYVVFYRLLAFLPEIETPYLKEYNIIPPHFLMEADMYYLDFRDDDTSFENLFTRHKDEYISQTGLRDEVQTLFFPIRNKKGKILATVTLSRPSPSYQRSAVRENLLLIFYIVLCTSLLFFLLYQVRSPSFIKEKKILPGIFVLLTLAALRLLFFPLSRLEKIENLSVFSPSSASMLSFGNLTKSPADIFLSALFLLLIICLITFYFRFKIPGPTLPFRSFWTSLTGITALTVALFILLFFQVTIKRLVFNSNVNLFRFSFRPLFFVLHLSILLFLISSVLLIHICFRFFSFAFRKRKHIYIYFLTGFVLYVVFLYKKIPIQLLLLHWLFLFLILLSVNHHEAIRIKSMAFLLLLAGTLPVYVSLHIYSTSKLQSLIQNTLQHIIRSQEEWGTYLIRESLQELDKEEESLMNFFRLYEPYDQARILWEDTLISKFNWYSSLEILDHEGKLLSRFALNVPALFHLVHDLDPSPDWSISRWNIPYLGKEKDFIVAYKDYSTEEKSLGRIIIYLSVDYDTLPFLYSANPYFELTRVSSLPSLEQFDFGFTVMDNQGNILFNPNRISTGIDPLLLEKLNQEPTGLWAKFKEKGQKFNSFYFRKERKIYSLFIAQKGVFTFFVEFLKLFIFYLMLSIISYFLYYIVVIHRKIRNPLWSFSNRVYISFVAVAIIPLLLFTFLTQNFFAKIFTEQLTNEAQAQASVAQEVMEDFLFLQEEEKVSLTLPAEDIVLWISSTISNDVNLYQDGRLISSSRREFFDSGLLPELIDGEIYFDIIYRNSPHFTQLQKIGEYTFHTLTIPYSISDAVILISLPFPLEQEEISQLSTNLVEFLIFISVFFIAVVLILARGIGNMIMTPIKKLLYGTKEVGNGNLEITLDHPSQDEIKTLIDGFNAMVKNLKRHQQEITDMSKKVAWAQMARKVAHDIKNPLTPIQLSAEHLLKVYEDDKEEFKKTLKESTSYIIKEVDKLKKTAQEFLELSRETTLEKETFNLLDLITETLNSYKTIFSEKIHFVEEHTKENLLITGDRHKIQISLRNIITNAIEAIPGKGTVRITAVLENKNAAIRIMDSGIGIDKNILDKIFKPDFSTKDTGTGIGLSIARKIIEDHGGSIEAMSQKNEGTTITVVLPIAKNKE
ncbi:MAG: HAMP domain-containing protein [Candidatus Aminicenantes bacterium]|nr:HAMP domain-containing protein [Candidatus Aminicenantes bacterium]